DRLTRLACRLFDVPIAVVTLIDAERQWFKSRQGLDLPEMPREYSICAHAILASETLVVPDAHVDPRFAEHPMVTWSPRIRFYAAQPIRAEDGHRVGTFSIMDRRPRTLDEGDRALLRDFAALAERELRDAPDRAPAAGANAP